MSSLIAVSIVAGVALALWTVGSLVVVASVEEAPFQVVERRDGYELRRYAPVLVAETAMADDTTEARNAGFRVLASYIFGANDAARKINMTAPVVMAPETIAMTAPVLAGSGRMAFVMPAQYQAIEQLPRPRDGRVTLRALPERVAAAHRFTWWATPERVAAKRNTLLAALARDGVKPIGAAAHAAFNPPMSAPFVQRHEIIADVDLR
jgi:hypothetical protein